MSLSDPFPRPVLVPVGDEPVDAALRFAADEAARSGCGVHLVHAVQLVALPDGPLVARVDAGDAGHEILRTALERARGILAEGTPVSGTVVLGAAVPSIVHAADAGARMVVLEHRSLSRRQRLVHRSVTSGVAAHTRVPAVAVPAGWAPAEEHGRVVTVGIDHPERAGLVLSAGFAAARDRGATLRIAHAWGPTTSHYELMLAGIDTHQWDTRASAEVQAAVDRLPGEVTEGVTHEIVVRHDDPASLLAEVAASSDLVVIGRHDPFVPVGSHIGPVARTVLQHVQRPVLLADPRPAHRWLRTG